ncbi:MAG: hypothetical protein A2297_01905 [Elusimicrobia bacterium RIFOXYB2_FULL_48_7]|nr:MAG: hypothetical protein A2297_01905 [Elusimicrobia bacterium RIFOXYB2_FULL_48_7]
MSLNEELGLETPIETVEHECLLNIVYTGTVFYRASYRYFSKYGITDAQFNVLMQLKYSTSNSLPQNVLSKRLFVNKADMTGIIDRLEKAKYVERLADPKDRRVNLIRITKDGDKTLKQAEAGYFEAVNKLMSGLKKQEIQQLIKSIETIRNNVKKSGLL